MSKKILSYGSIFICAAFAVALICTIIPGAVAAAVSMKVRPGFGGLYDMNQPVELLITLENSGPALNGLLVVKRANEQEASGSSPEPRFVLEVDVSANAQAQYRMVIPGQLAGWVVVEFVAGDLVLAQTLVEGVSVSGSRIALALSEEIMGSGFQLWLGRNSFTDLDLKYLQPPELPADNLALSAADLIMVDAVGLAGLTDEQIQALKEWVYSGGTLVLFGGAGAAAGGAFVEISPVLVQGQALLRGSLAGLTVVPVAAGELLPGGDALVVDNGVPLFAKRALGRGQVFYCAAAASDLNSEAEWAWSALRNSPRQPASSPYFDYRGYNHLTNISGYIPGLAGPSPWLLTLLWLAYAAIVGPLLYFLLRRADRRDWAWVAVPVVALLAAGCFHLLAPAKQLQSYLSQTLARVEIFTPGLAAVEADAAVVAPKGGDFLVDTAGGMYSLPMIGRYYGMSGASEDGKSILVRQDASGNRISFTGVEYGALRGLYAYGLQRQFGSIEGRLSLSGNTLKGELVNKTGLDLRDSALLLRGQAIKFDHFPNGGTVYIEETLDKWSVFSGDPQLLLFGSSDEYQRASNADPFFRERQIAAEEITNQEYGKPLFLGWSDALPDVFQVTGKAGQQEKHGLVLVKQMIEIDLHGEFSLPGGFVTPYYGSGLLCLADENGMVQYNPNGGTKPDGSREEERIYDLVDMGVDNHCRIDALEFQTIPDYYAAKVYSAEIYNWRQGKWDPLPSEGKRITGDELSLYLCDYKAVVKLNFARDIEKYEMAGDVGLSFSLWPGLAVEGVRLSD